MASLKEVRSRIQSVNSTQQITKAMKMVAAAKLRRAQDNIIQLRPYADKLNSLLSNLNADMDESVSNIFAEQREPSKVLIVLITSDRGLAGGFNNYAIKAAMQLITVKYKTQFAAGNVTVMPIGKKGLDYFTRRKIPMVAQFAGTFGKLSFEEVKKAAEFAMTGFAEGTYDRVEIVYNEFKNVATQIVRSEQFLPVLPSVVDPQKTGNVNYIFEPSKAEIIAELVPKSLKIIFYKAILESNAGEQGARMTAMDKATENAGEMLKALKLAYNRTRQAAITKEILEIVGGAEALKN